MNVGEVMTRPAITIHEDARLSEARALTSWYQLQARRGV